MHIIYPALPEVTLQATEHWRIRKFHYYWLEVSEDEIRADRATGSEEGNPRKQRHTEWGRPKSAYWLPSQPQLLLNCACLGRLQGAQQKAMVEGWES